MISHFGMVPKYYNSVDGFEIQCYNVILTKFCYRWNFWIVLGLLFMVGAAINLIALCSSSSYIKCHPCSPLNYEICKCRAPFLDINISLLIQLLLLVFVSFVDSLLSSLLTLWMQYSWILKIETIPSIVVSPYVFYHRCFHKTQQWLTVSRYVWFVCHFSSLLFKFIYGLFMV